MDELDDKIIEKLNENGRKSYREISRELNISLTTVANRIKKLEDEHIIERYIPLINQEKIGYDLTAILAAKNNLVTIHRNTQVSILHRTLILEP